MNSTVKAIAFWLALLAAALLLYNVFEHHSNNGETLITFSKFLEHVDNKNLKSAKIVDSVLTGELFSGGHFKTIIPTDYPPLYDKLRGVEFSIEHPTPFPWIQALISWAPVFFIIGFWIFFRRRLQGSAPIKMADLNVTEPNPAGNDLVRLEPDVAKAFTNAETVNEALRLVIRLSQLREATS